MTSRLKALSDIEERHRVHGLRAKIADVMSLSVCASAVDRPAGLPAGMLQSRVPRVLARLPAGSVPRRCGARDRSPWPSSSAAPNSSARSMDNPAAIANGRGNQRPQGCGRSADGGGAFARDTRTRGKRCNHAGPSVELEPPAPAVLAPVWHARDWQGPNAPRRSILQADRLRSGDVAHSC